MAREKKEDSPPPGAPAWMTTYGDMMTLLMTFFVLIVSFSTMQEAGFKAAMGSLQGALGVLTANTSDFMMTKIVHPENMFAFLANKPRQTTGSISKDLNFLSKIKGASLDMDKRGLHIILPANILFDSGTAEIKKDSHETLKQLGAFLFENDVDFIIEGHTDNTPISTTEFPSNWELSVARATAVMKFLHSSCALPYEKVSVAGFAEFKPLVSNDTPEGRIENRRVEIVILGEKIKRKKYVA